MNLFVQVFKPTIWLPDIQGPKKNKYWIRILLFGPTIKIVFKYQIIHQTLGYGPPLLTEPNKMSQWVLLQPLPSTQGSFFVLSYFLPLLLIVCLYSVMLHTLWNKVTLSGTRWQSLEQGDTHWNNGTLSGTRWHSLKQWDTLWNKGTLPETRRHSHWNKVTLTETRWHSLDQGDTHWNNGTLSRTR